MILKTTCKCFNTDYLLYMVMVFDLCIGCINEDLVYETDVPHAITNLKLHGIKVLSVYSFCKTALKCMLQNRW